MRAALVIASLIALSCSPARHAPQTAAEAVLAPDVSVRPLREGVWVHVTRDPALGPSNGLVVALERGALLVDTGWTDAQTARLIAYARDSLRRPIVRAVVTHSHADRMGGIGALRAAGVPVAAMDLTVRIAQGRRGDAPGVLFAASDAVYADREGWEVFYPGPGHAPDNVVVWLPRQRVLFGGCLVKSEQASAIGNTADADMTHWASAVEAVRARYPAAEVVVPGHGAVGGPGAYQRTIELIGGR